MISFNHDLFRNFLYISCIILSFIHLYYVLFENFNITDGKLQNLFLNHDNYHIFLIIFSFSTSIGFTYLPNLVIDLFKYINNKEKYDILLFERILLTVFFIIPNIITLHNLLHKNNYCATIFVVFFRLSFINVAYINSRILSRSIYKKIWTNNKITLLFSSTIILSISPITKNYPFILIVSALHLILNFYFSIYYLYNINIVNIIFNNNDLWKEKTIIFTIFSSIYHILFLIITVNIINSSALKNPTFIGILLFMINKCTTFIFISLVYYLIPSTMMNIEENKVRELRSFIRKLSHEIRTPFSIVQMNLDNTLDEVNNAFEKCKDCREFINQIKIQTLESNESCEVVINILNDILEIDKISCGLEKYEKSDISVGDLIRKSCKIFDGKAVTNKVTYSYDIWKSYMHIIVNIDYNKISMVLRNFISNSLKFTNEGNTIHLKIILKNIIKDKSNDKLSKIIPSENTLEFNTIRIEIIDDGIGIDNDNIHLLFNKSIQFEASKNQNGGGTGYGLLISKTHVLAHDGYIGVTSDGLDKGSTFWFELPIKEILDPNDINIPEHTPVINARKCITIQKESTINDPEYTQPNIIDLIPKVLIVEDNVVCGKVLSKTLDKLNCTSNIVLNGQLAIDELNDNKYDLILMDNQMPRMNGPDACKIIRNTNKLIPIIGVTGNILDDDVSHFISCGANEVLGKPTKKDDLETILLKYLIYYYC